MGNFGGFSWRRFMGISAAKGRISRRIGIPLSRSGRQQKLGRMLGGGCLLPLLLTVMGISSYVIAYSRSGRIPETGEVFRADSSLNLLQSHNSKSPIGGLSVETGAYLVVLQVYNDPERVAEVGLLTDDLCDGYKSGWIALDDLSAIPKSDVSLDTICGLSPCYQRQAWEVLEQFRVRTYENAFERFPPVPLYGVRNAEIQIVSPLTLYSTSPIYSLPGDWERAKQSSVEIPAGSWLLVVGALKSDIENSNSRTSTLNRIRAAYQETPWVSVEVTGSGEWLRSVNRKWTGEDVAATVYGFVRGDGLLQYFPGSDDDEQERVRLEFIDSCLTNFGYSLGLVPTRQIRGVSMLIPVGGVHGFPGEYPRLSDGCWQKIDSVASVQHWSIE